MMKTDLSLNEDLFSPPTYQFNGHLQTIIPGLFRRIDVQGMQRERWETPDGDFLDVDWYKTGSKRLAILSHGLEGDSKRPYILGMVRALLRGGFSVVTWNFRCCSGEINRKKRFYHSRATDDLGFIIESALKSFNPSEIHLVGFSLGGNITLKYLGEKPDLNPVIKSGVVISVPIHLASSCRRIMKFENRLYELRFLRSLKKKLLAKEKLMPGTFDIKPLHKMTNLWDFDNQYTGPIHGFENAEDYYQKCSSIFFLPKISVPTLLMNAQNDPFLSEECFPQKEKIQNENIITYYPQYGGHCGFNISPKKYHSEEVTCKFLSMQ